MKKSLVKFTAICGLSLSLLAGAVSVSAASEEQNPMDQTPFSAQMKHEDRMGGRMDGRMVISEPGTYTLTGSMRGTVLVDPGAGDVRLIMKGANIDGAGGPAIMALSGNRLNIELPDGSVNGMNGGFSEAIYSEIPLVFEGNGRLDLAGQGREAIHMEQGGLSFNGGEVHINGPRNAYAADNVGFNGGAVFNGPQQGNGGADQNMWVPAGNQMQNGGQNPFNAMQSGVTQPSAESAGEIVTGTTTNSAMNLAADYDNATTIVITDDDSAVKISESGTYVVTGSSTDGSITVKKGTTGVVLVLDDLDLTSTSGAALSINKNAEVQVVVSGTVTLTDNENPADEYSDDADVADAYDGAAIKVKAGSTAYITGSGTLNINGNAKNGIKAGDDSSLIIGGDGLTVNITAANDGINGNYDVTILSGSVNVSAGDDGVHADRILTIGDNGKGPNLSIQQSTEGLEGTVVNIAGGTVNVTASDDAINAANADGAYEGELDYAINITGGDVTVKAGADGVDSNGDINLIDGSLTIQQSANNGGDAGIDYDGSYYVSDGFDLNNSHGVAGPDGMPGMGGQMGGPGGMGGGFWPGR